MNDWRRAFTWKACTGLVAIAIIAPWAYALIQGGLAPLLSPSLRFLGIHSPFGIDVVVLAFSMAGALLAAALLAFSHTLVTRQGSFLLGLSLGVVTVAILMALRTGSQDASAFAQIAIEYATFIIACATVSHFAGRNHAMR